MVPAHFAMIISNYTRVQVMCVNVVVYSLLMNYS